jgi:hypothetical protein
MLPSLVGSHENSADLAVNIAGWGYAHLRGAEFAALRRSLPAWAVEGTPLHFFKHADEQTMLAVHAVDNAIQRHGFEPRAHEAFGVIAAPRFLGRTAAAAVIRRYLRDGAQGVTPHIISQHSLHSVSGAISVLLGCKGPNLGVGGGPRALDDALLTQLSLFSSANIPGVWLVGSAWDPEPIIDREGNCLNDPECFAFALAVQTTAANQPSQGSLRLRSPLPKSAHDDGESNALEVTAADFVRQMQAADLRQTSLQMTWPLSWGPRLEIELARPKAILSNVA